MIGGYSQFAIDNPPHAYQHFATDWTMDRMYVHQWPGVGLFMDPGLGKTRCTLTVLDMLFQFGVIRRALVVGPLRPIYGVWPLEIEKWGFPQSHVILHEQHAAAMAMDQQIELINYDGLEKVVSLAKRWDMIVFDESTFCKTWDSDRTKYARAMVKHIPKRLILTGTPAAESLNDLHSQIFLIDHGLTLGRNAKQFRMNFCYKGGWYGRKWLFKEQLADYVTEAVAPLVLRMDAEDHLDMPELVDNEIWCTMPDPAYKQYKKLKRELFAELETGDVFAASAASAYSKCRQFANGQVYKQIDGGEREVHKAHDRKIQSLDELQEELAGKPLLTFYSFTSDLNRIKQRRNSPFKKAPVIRGKMKNSDIEQILKEWNNGDHKHLLCQWQAGSHGLNMQGACNDVAAFGVIDSLEIFEQAKRRVYRQGVKGSQVRIHRLLTRGTVDEIQNARLHGKYANQDSFLQALKKHAKAA